MGLSVDLQSSGRHYFLLWVLQPGNMQAEPRDMQMDPCDTQVVTWPCCNQALFRKAAAVLGTGGVRATPASPRLCWRPIPVVVSSLWTGAVLSRLLPAPSKEFKVPGSSGSCRPRGAGPGHSRWQVTREGDVEIKTHDLFSFISA